MANYPQELAQDAVSMGAAVLGLFCSTSGKNYTTLFISHLKLTTQVTHSSNLYFHKRNVRFDSFVTSIGSYF